SLTETGVAVSPTVSSCTLLAGTTGTASCAASFTPSASGTASITGGYTPGSTDTSHETSPLSTAASVVVSPRLTIITVSCSSQVVVNQASTCNATVADSPSNQGTAITPLGTIAFTETGIAGSFTGSPCNTVIGATLGTASCSASFTPSAPGAANINATFVPSDQAHSGGSATSAATISSTLRITSTTVSCTTAVVVNQASTCTATVVDSSSNLGTPINPSGVVTFSSSGTATGTFTNLQCTLVQSTSSSRNSSCSTAFTGSASGNANINAGYSSSSTDTAHADSSSTTSASITVNPRTTTVAVSCVTPVVVGEASTCTATVSDSSFAGLALTPGGTVSFSETGVSGTFSGSPCTLVPSSTSGTASCSASFTSPSSTGSASVSAVYSSTDNIHSGSSTGSSAGIVVTLISTNIVLSCSSSATIGSSASCIITVSDVAPGTLPPTGTVKLSSNSTGTFNPAACILPGTATSESCTVSYSPIVGGHHQINATYVGDSSHTPIGPSSALIATTPAPLHNTATGINCAPNPVAVNQPSTCSATVTDINPSPTAPTGTVTFSYSGTGGSISPSSCTLVASTPSQSVCQFPVSVTPSTFGTTAASGNGILTASYSGDPTHNPSPSQAFSLTVNSRQTSTIVSCTTPVLVNEASTCTTTVSDSSTAGSPVTPTGSVSFSETGVSGNFQSSSCELIFASTGTASCSVTFTAPATSGSARVGAAYTPNDSVHSASQSSTPWIINVAQRTTTTSVQCTSQVVVNQPSTCTAVVTDSSTSGTAITPTGTVGFSETGVPGGFTGSTCNLIPAPAPGSASCTASFTDPSTSGTATINATYTPSTSDTAHIGSISTSSSKILITPRATITTVSCSSLVVVNQPASCTATVTDSSSNSGGPVTPSGNVGFSETGVPDTFTSPQCNLTPSTTVGTATCTDSFLSSAAGTASVSATYTTTNSAHSNSSTATTSSITVNLRTTSTSLSCTASVVVGQASSCSVVVTENPSSASSSITPSGTVIFTQSGVTASFGGSPCTLQPNGTTGSARCTVTLTASSVGSSTVTATYNGDSSHSGSNANFAVSINKRSTSTYVTCVASVVIGQASQCRAIVNDTDTGTPITPSGSVSFASTGSGSLSSQTCSLAGGSCTVSFTGSSSGTATVTGTYVPDTFHSASTSTAASIAVGLRGTTTSLDCTGPIIVNQNSTCTATVTSTITSGATPPSGDVSFTFAGGIRPNADSCVLLPIAGPSSQCKFEFTGSTTSTVAINATYTGNSAYKGSVGRATVTVNPRATSIVVSCTGSIVVNQLATCKATVNDTSTNGSPITPLGTVDFDKTGLPGNFAGSPCSLSGSGTTATCTVTFLDSTLPGTATINAAYRASDSIHSDSTTATAASVSVASRSSTVTVSCQPTPTVVGNSTVCTVIVTDGSPQPATTPTGTVKFSNATGVFATCSLTSLGKCSEQYTPTIVTSGPQTITASY
ncbi:Ig-like domain repeat protein, partial [Candidatus Bathyarchaeota archaeon]|nr:Ig-like domain repeat protein [Candidatus Bathyarchaeota archaeon]